MALLAVEFVALFVVAPALFAFTRHRLPAIPRTLGSDGVLPLMLVRDPHFDRRRLWDAAAMARYAPGVLGLFVVVCDDRVALVLRFSPETFLNSPKENPELWSLVMVAYPVLSVYPQGIIYRSFVFERYGKLFAPAWLMVVVSAATFSWFHIVFRNALAVWLTLARGCCSRSGICRRDR